MDFLFPEDGTKELDSRLQSIRAQDHLCSIIREEVRITIEDMEKDKDGIEAIKEAKEMIKIVEEIEAIEIREGTEAASEAAEIKVNRDRVGVIFRVAMILAGVHAAKRFTGEISP